MSTSTQEDVMSKKLEVGATVYVVRELDWKVDKGVDNFYITTKITKIGRKLVYVEARNMKFEIETMKSCDGFSTKELVLDIEQFAIEQKNKKERQELRRKIADSLSYRNKTISLEKLQQIASMLEIET